MNSNFEYIEHELYFEEFAKASRVKAFHPIAEFVNLGFPFETEMQVEAMVETLPTLAHIESFERHIPPSSSNAPRRGLSFRSYNRGEEDWLLLNIDIFPQTDAVIFDWRYLPAERIFPHIHAYFEPLADFNWSEVTQSQTYEIYYEYVEKITLPDLAASEFSHIVELPIALDLLRFERPVDDAARLVLSMSFPVRDWFALGVNSIRQRVRNE